MKKQTIFAGAAFKFLAGFAMAVITLSAGAQNKGVSIGVPSPDSSAIFHVSSTTKGVLLPHMDSVSRKLIAGPAEGLLLYDTDDSIHYQFTAARGWRNLTTCWREHSYAYVDPNDGTIYNYNDIYNDALSRIGINIPTPPYTLSIEQSPAYNTDPGRDGFGIVRIGNDAIGLNVGIDPFSEVAYLQARAEPTIATKNLAINPNGGFVAIGKLIPTHGLDVNVSDGNAYFQSSLNNMNLYLDASGITGFIGASNTYASTTSKFLLFGISPGNLSMAVDLNTKVLHVVNGLTVGGGYVDFQPPNYGAFIQGRVSIGTTITNSNILNVNGGVSIGTDAYLPTNPAPANGMSIQGHVYIAGANIADFPLSVSGGTSITMTNPGYFDRTNTGTYIGQLSWPISIYTDVRMCAEGYFASSDARIKNVISKSETLKDLATIMRLNVTDYKYKDYLGKSNQLCKGFIAQEVEKVIPEAVVTTAGCLPDIYVFSECVEKTDGSTTLITINKAHGLKTGDKVQIHGQAVYNLNVKEVISSTSFKVESMPDTIEQVFVYGKVVKDFHAVDYDRIFTTGIGAIQELAKRIDEQQAKIDALNKEKLAGEARYIQLMARLEKVENQLGVAMQNAK